MTSDFSFDARVAQRYNEVRAHPPEVSDAIGAAIVAQAGVGARVLEIGVGTGRIAWPVAVAGCPVVGFDLSAEMLAEVNAQHSDHPGARLALLRADMRHMPFAAERFGAVMIVHVLHLIGEWQRVLQEAARVLLPDGVLIRGEDWIDPESVLGQMRAQFRTTVLDLAPYMMPPSAGISREDVLAGLGGTQNEDVIAAEWTVEARPADYLRALEYRVDSESWVLDADLHAAVLARMREYAVQTWDDIEAVQPVTRRFKLKVTWGVWANA